MPKYFADFRQRCAVAQHLGCQRVAKLMSTRRRGLMPARWSACRTIDPMAHWPRNPRMGALPRKNTRRLVLRGRPCCRYAAIALPTSLGEEVRVALTTFPSYAHLAGFPINIVKIEKCYFT